MQANKPAHLDFVKVRVYTMAPMKPRTAKKIPIQDIIWISTIILLVSPEKQELIVTCNTVSLNTLPLISETYKIHCTCKLQFCMEWNYQTARHSLKSKPVWYLFFSYRNVWNKHRTKILLLYFITWLDDLPETFWTQSSLILDCQRKSLGYKKNRMTPATVF